MDTKTITLDRKIRSLSPRHPEHTAGRTLRFCGAGAFACPLILCVTFLSAQPPAATPPAIQQPPDVSAPVIHLAADNLTDIKAKLVAYQQMGEYDREIAEVVQPAHDWVATRITIKDPDEKLAAVFDVDETAISNLPNLLACGFCAVAIEVKMTNPRPAIAPVLDLWNFTKSKGVAVIVVTGRSESRRAATIKEMQDAGYSGWQEFLMRPEGDTGPVGPWKTTARAGVEREGYKIILNIGDQLSDLTGGHAERTYKLPNPFYFVP
jgi:predicted secreted acid phosphatase